LTKIGIKKINLTFLHPH